jgi:hypothetical protein
MKRLSPINRQALSLLSRFRRAHSEGGLTVRFRLGPPPGVPPSRVTATAWDALAPRCFDELRFVLPKAVNSD